jgi:16S rRNA (cytosine1402-N4)-methyltransferase
MPEYHPTVLGPEAAWWLRLALARVVVDATAGHGGHVLRMLEHLAPGALVVMLDAQEAALEVALPRVRDVAAAAGVHLLPIRGNFRRLADLLREHGVEAVDGVLYDQGLSSADIESSLGFSFQTDAPLDMRRSDDAPASAADLLERLDAGALASLFREFGDEPWADRIAQFVVRARGVAPLRRTSEFVRVVESAVPRRAWPRDIHVATRCMMALRYAVNDDIAAIEESIGGIVPMMRAGGRLACISFCSREDRAVKRAMRSLAYPCVCPKDLPVCGCGRKPMLRIMTKRAVRCGDQELALNRRSRSAALRVAERV